MKKKRQQAASKGRGDRGCRHRLGPALSLAFLLAAACGSRAGNEKPKPIAECQQYEREMARCTGRQMPIASQPAALASTEAQRERLKQLCLVNIERLREACR